MAFESEYGTYNVEGSFNEFFRVNLTAAGVPGWMPSAYIKWDFPEDPLFSGHSGHTFSVTHLPATTQARYQGRNVGEGELGATMQGMAEVNCWVSREAAGAAYSQRLRHMGDMVSHLFASARSIPITDVYSGLTDPPNLTAVMRVGEADQASVGTDPNPDVVRRRYLVQYSWVERVSG